MCCKINEVNSYIKEFEAAKLDSIHFDVMDGHYVKNIMLGTKDYKSIKEMTEIPVDIHLMCIKPDEIIEYFDPQPGDRVSFHLETCYQPYRLLQNIRERGCKAGLVLNPETPINILDEVKGVLDYITIMTVNPGFAGQVMVPDALTKIARVKKWMDDNSFQGDLFVDGNTNFKNANRMRNAGANGFVAGTSSLMKGVDSFGKLYKEYYQEINKDLY